MSDVRQRPSSRTRGRDESGPVQPEQRFTAANPCPICGGHQDMPQGIGMRCHGYWSSDGRHANCARVESDREAGESGCWVHSVPETPRDAPETGGTTGEVEDIYVYENESGAPLFEVVRFADKQFRQRRPGGTTWNVKGVRLVPYRLPQVIAAVERGETIYVVEGEKDVHAVEAAGGVATCNPGGAGKWRDEYSQALAGAEVVVVADRDDGPGITHARQVRTSLLGVAETVDLAEAAFGKDAHDHLAAGHLLAELVPVAPRFERMRLGSYEPKPPVWLVEPVLLANTYTLIAAAAGAGKTMLTIAALRSLIEAGGTVVYLDMENGPDVFKERAQAIGYTDETLDEVAYFPYPSPARGELEELVAEVAALRPDIVVFDAKANFSAQAGLDEDNSIDTTKWHQWVIQPLQRAGAGVLDLDHTGHSGERARGSSAKEAVAEASWYLTTDRQFDANTTATLTLKRGLKNRRGVLPQELRFTIGGSFVFKQLTDASDRDDDRKARDRTRRDDIARVVRNHWSEHGEGLSLSAIAEAVTGPSKEVRDAAKDLGNTPNSGFEIVTGARNAVMLRPTKAKS